MVKKKTFKDKPKPPNKDQILADFASSSGEDVVFQQEFQNRLCHVPFPENQSISQHLAQANVHEAADESATDKDKINTTYEHVTRLLKLHSQLFQEPDQLNKRYEHLEKLGQDVSDSIEELKSAAESVITKEVK